MNSMLFDRGTDSDYDSWEQLGNKGWGWEGLKPYFKKSTHYTPPSASSIKEFNITFDASAYGNGPAQVAIPSFQYPDIKPIFDSFRAEDIPWSDEGFLSPIGAFWTPNSYDNATGTRSHARKTYYDPVKARSNLKLLTGTRVNKILLENHGYGSNSGLVAKGVRMASRENGAVAEVYAKKEVILAAGGVFTPQLLQLSGIGPKEVLTAANITVKKDFPSVGSNFQDHVPVFMQFNLSNLAFPNQDALGTNASFNASSADQYAKDHGGPWTFIRSSASVFVAFKHFSSRYKSITAKISQQDAVKFLPKRYSTSSALLSGFLKQREILIGNLLSDKSTVGELPVLPSGRATVAVQKLLSRGTITLNSTHPEEFPIVQYNTLTNPIDGEILAELVRWNRAHWSRKELSRYSPVENLPGLQYQTDEEIIRGVIEKNIIQPSFSHAAGTCAMMPRNLGGCVSDELLVYDIARLSVVDASIIPLIPATHLQATMYAVAEKAADIIKQR